MHRDTADRMRAQTAFLVPPTVDAFRDPDRLRLLPLVSKSRRIMQHQEQVLGLRCDKKSNSVGTGADFVIRDRLQRLHVDDGDC